MSSRRERPSKPISDQDIRELRERALLRFVANVQPPFYTDHETKFLSYQSDFLGFLRLGKYKEEINRILKVCANEQSVDGQYFTATLIRVEDESPKPIVTLKPGAEWSDVRVEAAAMLNIPPASLITPQAEEAYQWLIKKGNIGKTWTSEELAKRFKLDPLKDPFWRLRLLRDHRITIECEGYWSFRIFVSESPAPELTLSPLNPVFPEISKNFTKADLERLRDFFENLILVHAPKENVLLVARIGKRSEVMSCFPSNTEKSLAPAHYYEALSAMPAIKGTLLFYNFGHDLGPWCVGFSLTPDSTWENVKQSIELRRLEKSPSEKYGLTKKASDLLSWLLSKDFEKFELHLSPDVEKELKLGVGIDIDQIGKKHIRQLFDLLCQEITEKTEFEARVVPCGRIL